MICLFGPPWDADASGAVLLVVTFFGAGAFVDGGLSSRFSAAGSTTGATSSSVAGWVAGVRAPDVRRSGASFPAPALLGAKASLSCCVPMPACPGAVVPLSPLLPPGRSAQDLILWRPDGR